MDYGLSTGYGLIKRFAPSYVSVVSCPSELQNFLGAAKVLEPEESVCEPS